MTNPESMVERVARALFDKEWNDAGSPESEWETGERYWIESARAAIQAMMEPTEEMVESGSWVAGSLTAMGLWQDMIDEALK